MARPNADDNDLLSSEMRIYLSADACLPPSVRDGASGVFTRAKLVFKPCELMSKRIKSAAVSSKRACWRKPQSMGRKPISRAKSSTVARAEASSDATKAAI